MDNFKAVYKILSSLEACMDLPTPNIDMFSAKTLNVSEERWQKYIEMMLDVGYIKGVTIERYITGQIIVDCSQAQITLKGLEYLQENAIMKKIFNATVKGVEIVANVASTVSVIP